MGEISEPGSPQAIVPVIPEYARKEVQQYGCPANWTPELTTDHPTIRLADPNELIEPSEDRTIPYVLRGRHVEFNRLVQLLEKPFRAVHLITAPPPRQWQIHVAEGPQNVRRKNRLYHRAHLTRMVYRPTKSHCPNP